MKKPLILFLCVLIISAVHFPVSAASTPTPSPEESDNQEKIQERLKKVVDEKKDQIKGVSTESQEKRAFVGTVKRVSEEALTVDTRKGTQIITLSPEIAVVQEGKAFKVTNIEIDSQVVVMGYQKGEDFTPKRILVLKKPLQTVKKTIWVGTITKMDKVSITLKSRDGQEKNFSFSTKPILEDNSGTTIKMADVEVDQDVVLLTVPEEANSQSVKDSAGKIVRLHSLIVADATPQEKAKDKTTPTPKVTVKPTATPKAAATKKPTATPVE